MAITNDFANKLIEILPKIRTRIQLTGLAVAIVGFVLIRVSSPTALGAQFALGSIGIILIVFAQVFHFLKDFPAQARLKLVLALFFGFLLFSGIMFWLTLYFIGDAKRNIATAELRNQGIDISPISFLDKVRQGNPNTIKLFLDAGFSPEKLLSGEDSPLAVAARLNNSDPLDLLLRSGAYVNIQSNGATPLIAAIESNQIKNVQRLLDHNADPSLSSDNDPCKTPLSVALYSQNTELLAMLIKHGARPNLIEKCEPILVNVARTGTPEAVNLLIQSGAQVNLEDGRFTPLMAASGNNFPKTQARVDSLKALLKKGANPNARDKDGTTALMYAVRSGSIEAVHALLAAKADPNLYDGDGFGPLMESTQLSGRINVMNALIAAGANPNVRTIEAGLTPLHLANCEKAILLLRAGADAHIKDNKGRTSLDALPSQGIDPTCDEVRNIIGANLALQGTLRHKSVASRP